MLCHGNVARSPLAAAVLAAELGPETVRSRGVSVRHPHRALKKVREYAELYGLYLGRHKSRQVTPGDVAWADVIVYVDPAHVAPLATRDKPLVALGSYLDPPEEVIRDPAFWARGPEMREVLDKVVRAAKRLAVEMGKRKPPVLPGGQPDQVAPAG